jgi:epoxyqueuosine reductase
MSWCRYGINIIILENKKIFKAIRQYARELGLLDCRIVPVEKLSGEEEHLEEWLRAGMQGTMEYMSKNIEKRSDPGLLVEQAKTMIVVLQNYYNCTQQYHKDAPILSKYAYGTDYHDIMREKLYRLMQFIDENIVPCTGRVFVDSAPVLERAWGARAGLGWIGKNSCLISQKYGSFFFIGELLINASIPYENDEKVPDHCGSCTRCMDLCPTQAIVSPRTVDARRCIAYQTIELKGDPDVTLHGKFKNRVFGCDICQDVCPWNSRSVTNSEPAFRPDHNLMHLKREDWYRMDQSQFDSFFRNSAVQRAGFDKIKATLAFLDNVSSPLVKGE